MTQKPLAIAAVVGALIIALALVYHGRQLAEVSRRLDAMDQRTTSLDTRLEQFTAELPMLVGEAGHNAGRQAVHGAVEELVEMPLKWLGHSPASGASNTTNSASSPEYRDLATSLGVPWVRFDIREPVVRIEVLPNLKEVPAIPWLPTHDGTQTRPQTNQVEGTMTPPTPGEPGE